MFKFLDTQELTQSLKENVSPSLMKTFGLFGLLNFPLLYILGASLLSEKPIALYLRSVGFIVCLLLALIDYWPYKLNRYRTFYWFVAITYCLPFFATYMFIENEGSVAWQVKITVAMFWLVLVTNWVQALIILPLGIILALLTFTFISGPLFMQMNTILGDILNYMWTVVIASIFARRKEIIQKITQRSLKMQAAAIAHEMRTPLAAISHLADGLKINLPILINTQQTAQDKDESVTYVHKSQLQYLEDTPTELEAVTKSAFIVIDMLLMNLRENPSETVLEKHSILDCVKNALDAYALTKREKALISLDIADDFEIKANSHLLKHVFFNLLKNSLHYIKAVRKGKIVIWTEKGEQVNKLYFKDTGKGISKESLPYVFNQFYSRTDHGTGVGLAFCKMVMQHLGGDITCDSIEGEFTQFTLIFPVLK